MHKILIIQTAFIGDVILATSLIETLNSNIPDCKIDFMIRQGNEGLLNGHPYIKKLIVWNKKENKYKNLFNILKSIRKEKYNTVINLQRFAATGILTSLSCAKNKLGFKKNPFSFTFTQSIDHKIGNGLHEVERNHQLIKNITCDKYSKPALYPSEKDYITVDQYKTEKYVCIAPASVWYTKQLPMIKWVELINKLPEYITIYLLGATNDKEFCDNIIHKTSNKKTKNLAGQLPLLASAALMKYANMNFVNDSAPLHIASAMNAPTTAFFCSTTPNFGFGPLSEQSQIIEIEEKLDCRPCGLHGNKVCPKQHFRCAMDINIDKVIDKLKWMPK